MMQKQNNTFFAQSISALSVRAVMGFRYRIKKGENVPKSNEPKGIEKNTGTDCALWDQHRGNPNRLRSCPENRRTN